MSIHEFSLGRQQPSGNINSFNNNNSFNNIVNYFTEIDDEGRQILEWLSPLEPQKRHWGVRTERLGGLGNWVLETSEFQKWRDGEDGCVEPVLICCGNPGVGKTYVSSLAIDHLCDQVEGEDVAVVGLYCDFLAQQEQSAANMLGAMLKQLASRGGIPEHTREAFQKAKKEFGGQGLPLLDMVDTLKKTITSLPRLFICIDGLDECTSKHRRELIQQLREIVGVSQGVRVLITGRPHIEDEIARCFNKTLRIPLSPTNRDIHGYLEMRLGGDSIPNSMDDDLRADIIRIIPEKISESFRLVSLTMKAILGEATITQRRKKLNKMTEGDGLGDAYAETQSRIKGLGGTRSKLGMDVLMWVSHAQRPFHVNELCHALGVEEGSADLDTGNIPTIETLLEFTLGLITVEKSSSTVQLVHYTLQKHLSNNTELFPNAHSIIAKVCLTYLNFPYVRCFSPALRSVPPTAPFVEYASCYWGIHARSGTTESVKTLALKLLDGYDKHISSKLLLLRSVRDEEQPFDLQDTPTGFTGLHGAAYFGCPQITAALLKTNKVDVRETDFRGKSATFWARKGKHEEVVKLLQKESDFISEIHRARNGSARFLEAAQKGHERDMKILLERRGINPDKPDIMLNRTPLSWASRNGHAGIVRMLLERNDVNPNHEDRSGLTPLLQACQGGHEGVVRRLLERNDVSPNRKGWSGASPLVRACEGGYEGIVRMLLERNDVNPNQVDLGGLTPLCQACMDGHEGIVRMLLERNDVKPNQWVLVGITPLMYASAEGHEGVVRILLERGGVNPNQWCLSGHTPLSMAGSPGVERILREWNEANGYDSDTWHQRLFSGQLWGSK